MARKYDAVATFPSTIIPAGGGKMPIEVSLIAQIGIGAGDALIRSVSARQAAHDAYIDALDEPSARIGAMHPDAGDSSSLYTFSVGEGGHPFHRHKGNRVFTAISGSGGARLRFSTADEAALADAPHAFIEQFHEVILPPDCLFSVRFGGGTWHQFVPLRPERGHPALFALSFHPDEFGGLTGDQEVQQVASNAADIPSLTEVLPEAVQALLDDGALEAAPYQVVHLSLDAPSSSLQAEVCAGARGRLGAFRSWIAARRPSGGFTTRERNALKARNIGKAPAGSLLQTAFPGQHVHEDMTVLEINAAELSGLSASQILERLLDGFLQNPPVSVGRMMAFRNAMVKPFGLRTSPLGCPVSSLLGTSDTVFAGRFPVHAQRVSAEKAEVLLGADDRHLAFRSCVGVERDAGRVRLSLGTRVNTANRFGAVYMAAIDAAHRAYVSPVMLRMAAEDMLDGQPAHQQRLATA